MAPSDALLQEMLDEFQLRKLVHGYCRAVDRGDDAQLRSLYHHAADDDHGGFSTGPSDEFFGAITAARPYLRSMQHNVTTTERKIVTDWAHVNDPSSVDLSHPITKDAPREAPDTGDPSHQFFSLLSGNG